MANVKITELTALTTPVGTDVLPIVDVLGDVTKKVTVADLNSATSTTTTDGDIIIRSSGSETRLPIGSEGQALLVSSGLPVWGNVAGGYTDPLTTDGDIVIRSGGVTTRLGIGSEGQVLKVSSGLPVWAADAGGDVVLDTTPQLGGDLDVNGYDIVSASGGNVEIAPDTTGSFVIRGNNTDGSITLNCTTNTHGVTIQSPPHASAATYTLILPDDTGTTGQVLSTNGTGTLSWLTATEPGDNISTLTNDSGFITSTVTGDFTVDTDTLYVDSTNNRAGIGTTSPLGKLNISSGDTGFTPSADADELFLENTGNCGITLGCGTNQKNNIYFGEQTVGVSRGAIVYDTNDDYMAFSTAGLTSERLRILASGGLTFNGDTAAANALDDYEEGTFTPTVFGKTAAGTYTLGTSVGTYTKVGNKVTVIGTILAITESSAGSGAALIGNLPFTMKAASNTDAAGSVELSDFDVDNATVGLSLLLLNNENRLHIRETRDATVNANVQCADITSGSSNIRFTITYLVD